MEEVGEDDSKSGFLLRNLVRGLIWFAAIITAFILAEDYIQEHLQPYIVQLKNRPLVLYSMFFASEVVFGILPPEVFMLLWYKAHVSLPMYISSLTVLTVLSYVAGVIGYYIGKNFSKSPFYLRIYEKHLSQYDRMLRRYGGYLVFVGAVTPVPFRPLACLLAR
ncbi:MAG: VTT domain-containing protein [Bacteroidia bacterium]|nr:VTT domain-containing protein [Bacteroidia bacterium]